MVRAGAGLQGEARRGRLMNTGHETKQGLSEAEVEGHVGVVGVHVQAEVLPRLVLHHEAMVVVDALTLPYVYG